MTDVDENAIAARLDSAAARTIATAAMVGTALEWYDFFLFGTASALIFDTQYFVSGSRLVGIMASFASLAVGFVARPIGALIFGAMGDRIGRRQTLLITIVGIGLATGLIGLLPTYATIGVIAPIALTVLRLLQGLSVGGEWGGAITMAVEHAPAGMRARYAAMPQVGSPIGTLLSSGGFFLVSLMPGDTFHAWGWRIPFLAAFGLLIISVLIRRRLEESPVFRQLERTEQRASSPIIETITRAPAQMITAMAASLLGIAGFFLVTTFLISYGTNDLGLSPRLMLAGTLVAAVVEIFVIISGGRLGGRYGASRVAIAGSVLTMIVAFPVFAMVQSKIAVLVIIGMAIGQGALSYPYAVVGAILAGLFPARFRYTGVAFSSNLAGLVGGFVPMVATALFAAAGGQWWPEAVLLMVIAAITLIGAAVAPRMNIVEEAQEGRAS